MSSALPALGKHRTRSLGQRKAPHVVTVGAAQQARTALLPCGAACAQLPSTQWDTAGRHLGVSLAVLLSASPGNHLLKVSASGGGKRAASPASAAAPGAAAAAAAAPFEVAGGNNVPPLL